MAKFWVKMTQTIEVARTVEADTAEVAMMEVQGKMLADYPPVQGYVVSMAIEGRPYAKQGTDD